MMRVFRDMMSCITDVLVIEGASGRFFKQSARKHHNPKHTNIQGATVFAAARDSQRSICKSHITVRIRLSVTVCISEKKNNNNKFV
jgi:hypothetical protein